MFWLIIAYLITAYLQVLCNAGSICDCVNAEAWYKRIGPLTLKVDKVSRRFLVRRNGLRYSVVL